jgi:UDP-glucose 4-epimerase
VSRRVVVTGATGNVGVAVMRALSRHPDVEEAVGLARHPPDVRSPLTALPGTSWQTADVVTDDLTAVFDGADAVVHLAWLIQPSRDLDRLWEVNVGGTARVLDAAARAGVRAIVHASSVGAYSPSPPDRRQPLMVDESWPTHGVPTSAYSREKAYTERLLDAFEARHGDVRVVRLRPSLIFQAEAASRIRRLFLGTLAPARLLASGKLPVLPTVRGLRFQAVHADDVADAFVTAVVDDDVRGAFNLAAAPVLSLDDVAEELGARAVPVPSSAVRGAVRAGWTARVQPIDVGWYDLARRSPLLDTTRAHQELGWSPRCTATQALRELFAGLERHEGAPTPALEGDEERSRGRELTTGQGAAEGRGG